MRFGSERSGRGGRLAAGIPPKSRSAFSKTSSRRHVSRHREDRVVRAVEGAEEALDVRERRGVEVVEVAVAVVGVLPLVEEGQRQLAVLEEAVRVVLDVDPDLLLHDVALVVERLLPEGERGHPVGLEEEDPLEGRGGGVDDVDRHVGAGLAVVAPSGALADAVEDPLARVRGPLEHQVLEEVREAGTPRGSRREPIR